MKNRMVPEIRFAGFNDEWEQQHLGEVSDIKTGPFGSILHAEDYVEDGVPIITTEHFKSGKLPDDKCGIPQVSISDYKRLKSYILKKSDIVFSRVGSVDVNALVSETQDGWLFSGRVLRVRSNERIDSQFLHYELDTTRAKNDVISRAVGQTMPSINTEILKDTKIYISKSLIEQNEIGNLFYAFDDAITFHQHELDNLKQMKQGFLQKMFPNEGAKVPEIRFPGFTDEWEQRKLGEILKVNSGRDYKHLQEGDIPVYGTGGYMLSVSDKLSDDDAIGIGRKGTINKPQMLNAPFWTVDTLFYMTSKPEVNLHFCYCLATNINWKKLDESTGVPSLSKSSIEKIVLQIPSHNEQIIIGNFFKQIDDTISIHQQELDLLKQTKKAFLQKLFI